MGAGSSVPAVQHTKAPGSGFTVSSAAASTAGSKIALKLNRGKNHSGHKTSPGIHNVRAPGVPVDGLVRLHPKDVNATGKKTAHGSRSSVPLLHHKKEPGASHATVSHVPQVEPCPLPTLQHEKQPGSPNCTPGKPVQAPP